MARRWLSAPLPLVLVLGGLSALGCGGSDDAGLSPGGVGGSGGSGASGGAGATAGSSGAGGTAGTAGAGATGGAGSGGSAGAAGPTAAPPCPPGVTAVTELSQLTDAERDNGSIAPDVGVVPDGAPLAGDPAAFGPFAVDEQVVQWPRPPGETGTLPGTIYAPRADGTAQTLGPFPLVLVMPGFASTYDAYAGYSQHLATHGFVVLGLNTVESAFSIGPSDHEGEARRAIAALGWMIAAGPLKERIDPTKIAVAGHSKGGKVAFWAAALDARIDLVIGWDPSNGGGAPCFIDRQNCNTQAAAPNCNATDGSGAGLLHLMHAETFIVGAPPDTTNPEAGQNALNFFRGAPGPATFVQIDASHASFATGGGIGTQPNPRVHEYVRRATVSKLLARFRGIAVEPAYLPGGPSSDPDGIVLVGPLSK